MSTNTVQSILESKSKGFSETQQRQIAEINAFIDYLINEKRLPESLQKSEAFQEIKERMAAMGQAQTQSCLLINASTTLRLILSATHYGTACIRPLVRLVERMDNADLIPPAPQVTKGLVTRTESAQR